MDVFFVIVRLLFLSLLIRALSTHVYQFKLETALISQLTVKTKSEST